MVVGEFPQNIAGVDGEDGGRRVPPKYRGGGWGGWW